MKEISSNLIRNPEFKPNSKHALYEKNVSLICWKKSEMEW